MKLTVVISCFNEKLTILRAIDEAKALDIDKEIIVIDNCSTDGTRQILEGLGNDKSLRIILHSRNMGAGYSGREGNLLAKGDYLYGPGADLEYRMQDVCRMIEKLESENLDAVFGSRLLDRKGISLIGLIKERPFWLGSIIATFLTNLFYRKSFTDVIATKLVKTEILREVDCKSSGQAFEFELVSKLCKRGYKIGEVGVSYKPRSRKQGKTIKAFDIIPAILVMIRVRIFG